MWKRAWSRGWTLSPRTTVSQVRSVSSMSAARAPIRRASACATARWAKGRSRSVRGGEAWLLGGGEFDEGVDAGAGDAECHCGLVVRQPVADGKAQLRRAEVAADGVDEQAIRHERVVEAHVVGAGAAHPGDVPGVHDLVAALRHHGIEVAVLHRFVVVVAPHGGAEEFRVVNAAHELPLARNPPAAVLAVGAAHGGGGTRHDGHGILEQFRAMGEAGSDEAEGLDADHQVPAGAAVGAGRPLR